MNELQQILLGLSNLTRAERDLLTFVVKNATKANNFEVTVGVQDKVFHGHKTTHIYMINETGSTLFSKILCFKMHQEQRNTLSFRCIRSIRRVDSETYVVGLSFVLASVIRPLKGYLKTDTLEHLSSLKHPIAKYFFLVHHDNFSMSIEEFRALLQFSETNKEKRNWMHRHVNPAFEELKQKFSNLYRLSYRREKSKIIGVDLMVG